MHLFPPVRARLAVVLVGSLTGTVLCVWAAGSQVEQAESERQAGLAYLGERQFGRAVEAYERAIAIDPAGEHLYLELTDILLALGLAEAAEVRLTDARTRFPESRSPNYNVLYHDLAELEVRLGRIAKAREAMVEAARVDGPVSAALVYKRIGDFSTDLLRFDEALAAYQRSFELEPSPDTRLAIANLHLRTNDLDRAFAEFTGLIEDGWDGADIRHGIAEVHFRRGEYPEAAAEADRVLAMESGHRRALYIRGSALVRLGSRELGQTALREYRRLEAIASSEEHRRREIQAFRSGGMDLVLKRDYPAAIELFRRGIDAYPLSHELYLGLGQAQSESGLHRDAAQTFQAWIDLGLDEGDVAYEYLVRESGLIEEADRAPSPTP